MRTGLELLLVFAACAMPTGTRAAAAALPGLITLQVDGGVRSLAFSPSGNLLAVGCAAQDRAVVRLLKLPSGEEIAELDHPSRVGNSQRMVAITSMAFSPDGKVLATATGWGVKIWDVETAKETVTLYGYGTDAQARMIPRTTCVAFSPDGSLLAASGIQRTELWDVAERQQSRMVGASGGGVAFSPDGRVLATAEGNNRVHLWDVATGQQLAEEHAMMGPLFAVVFTPDGKFVSATGEGSGKVWSIEEGANGLLLQLRPEQLLGRDLSLSADGKRLVTCGSGIVRLYDVAFWRELAVLDRNANCAAISPDGTTVAAGGVDHRPYKDRLSSVRIWSTEAVLRPEAIAAQARQTATDLVRAAREQKQREWINAMLALGPHSEAAGPVLIEALRTADAGGRQVIASALKSIGLRCDWVVPLLEQRLKDDSAELRRTAAGTLRQIRDAKSQ